jgi:L,D-peptidoglycan transpeptidase YkuD (ErfK/YbiS/YcfS/YnhG family)
MKRASLVRSGQLRSALLRTALLAALSATVAALVPGVAQAAGPLPAQLSHLGASRQVLIVQVARSGDMHGTIQGWEKDTAGRWRQTIGTQRANIGRRGLVAGGRRIQNDMRTPVGTYPLTFSFGIYANPGTRLPYKVLDDTDYWAGDQRDPKTYNLFQNGRPAAARWRTSESEHLRALTPAYRYAVNIDWNLPRGVRTLADGQRVAATPADVRRGSAIFLHTFGSTGPNGYTAGCVAMDLNQLTQVLRWLDPRLAPKIVIGSASTITRV